MNGKTIRTFLGANSCEGFYSLYGAFPGECRTIVIKGGAGSGKSSIMKKTAAEALKRGYFVEYCYCSSDAESLDGIRIPEMSLCMVDGTPPHITEPRFPGAVDEIFYTGQFWDSKKLRENAEEIQKFSTEIKAYFARAYRYLSAAGKATEDTRIAAEKNTDKEKMKKFAVSLVEKYLKGPKGEAKLLPRFLSGISPQGLVVHRDTVYTLAKTVYVLRDPYGISSLFLDFVLEKAIQHNQEIYVFYDPLTPSVVQHIVLPQAEVGFVTSNKIHPFEPQNGYRIHLERFIQNPDSLKARCKSAEKLTEACLKEALFCLNKEKSLHDDLEEFYIDAMDFGKLNSAVNKFIKNL